MSLVAPVSVESWSVDGALPGAVASVSRFRGTGGAEEVDVVVRPLDHGDIRQQLDWVEQAYALALESAGIEPGDAVLRRFLCSDLSNQAAVLRQHALSEPSGRRDNCAVSWIQQAPAPPARISLWAHHVAGAGEPRAKTRDGQTVAMVRGGLTHLWTAALAAPDAPAAFWQTDAILQGYAAFLAGRGLTVAGHCLRTWWFVRDVDADYEGFVRARRGWFGRHGLTADTHYIASTGIGGAGSSARERVVLDAYAVAGLRPGQVEFLCAPTHLCPTHRYGVTFERATAVSYADRRHIFLSGTASIDHNGKIMHPGHVGRQLERTLENIEALLARGGATPENLTVLLAYVRDPADQEFVRRELEERFAPLPLEVVVAPVCRPGWLVEIEGTAVIAASNPALAAF